MKRINVKQINLSGKQTNIDTAINKFINDKKLLATDIASINFNADLTSAIVVYHSDEIIVPEKETEE